MKTIHFKSPAYALEKILAFAGPGEQGKKDLLRILVHSAQNNAADFKLEIIARNRKNVCELAHKMLSLFKQIQATDIIPLLERLEQKENTGLQDEEFFSTGQAAFSLIDALLDDLKSRHLRSVEH